MRVLPKAHPEGFRRDVVAVAGEREASTAQIAKDFGISESCLANWLRKADIQDGVKSGVTAAESVGEKRGLRNRPGPAVHDDLVKRKFTAKVANTLRLTDITEHATGESRLYLCAIKDVYSNRIVGYCIDSTMKSALAVSALRNAVALRGRPVGVIVHSDRGSQLRSRKFLKALRPTS